MSTRRLFWLIPVGAATVGLTAYLYFSGQRGVAVATILIIPITVGGIVVTIMLNQRDRDPEPPVSRGELAAVVIGVLVLIGVTLGVGWRIEHHRDLPVDFGPPFQLSEESSEVVTARIGDAQWRGELIFVPILANTAKLGDCVQPAVLHITPIVDGGRLSPLDVVHQQRVTIPIPEGSREVKLEIEYTEPGDQSCRVETALTGGTLSR